MRAARLSTVFHNSANPGSEQKQVAADGFAPRRRSGRLEPVRLVGLLLLAAGSLSASALEPATSLAGYGRQAWVMENGLPQNTVQALVQTRDGFIWLGTEVGLVRFDGNGFEIFDRTSRPALPGNDVQALLAASDGSLWIGTSEGLARWKDGAVKPFGSAQGLPGNNVRSLAETSEGVLWAWTDGGLARLVGDRFQMPPAGMPGGVITSIAPDGRGGMWVGTTIGAAVFAGGALRGGGWVEAGGGSQFGPYKVGPGPAGGIAVASNLDVFDPILSGGRRIASTADLPPGGVQFMSPLHGDGLALASNSALVEVVSGKALARMAVGRELPGSRIQVLLTDRRGALWIGTNGGLCRFAAGKLERFPVTDSLASASILTLIEDREGDLWVGTETGGLHILRDQRFKAFTSRDGLSSDNTTAVVEDGSGALWVGTGGGGLNVIKPARAGQGKITTYTVRNGLPSDVILSLAAAPNDDVWVGTPDGLGRIHAGAVSSFTSADGLPDDFIRSLLVDVDGSLWVGTRRGLTHWTGPLFGKSPGSSPGRGNRMVTFTHSDGLGSDLVGAMARDTDGDLWVATLAGLSRLHQGAIANYTTRNGLSSNIITALLPREKGTLLIGTQDRGWNLWDGRRFTHVTRDRLTTTSIHAILDDGHDHLWFATGGGVARCDCAGAAGAMNGLDCMNWIEFSTADGLISRETAINSHPSAWRAADGRIWFATPKGLESVDPAHFSVNMTPPPVLLERFAVDDQDQPLGGPSTGIRIPAGHNHFQFDYAGLSFVAPQKVRYRYMLEGFDHAWTEAGSRRIAYYTNIPPGRYTFRVQAANNDGVWNARGAELVFELRPHFYQTVWFYGLLALALAAIVVLLLRLRLLRAQREFGAVLEERNRIAREIHDTLAQGYVGISVQLEVLTELLRHNKVEAAARQLDVTRGYVREGLADARQSIWSLRSHDAGETTLPVEMRRIVEQADGHGLDAKFNVYGAYHPMSPGTEREILRVAQEAIHNVKKHAEASSLRVQLEYGPAEIALEVRDNGRGFRNGAAAGTGRAAAATGRAAGNEKPPGPALGHYGLTGMRERAAAIKGALEITSEPGSGTTVRLRAPAPKDPKE